MDNIFIRKNTTQLSNVNFNLCECSGFTLEKLDDVLLEFNNKYKKLSNIMTECSKKVKEFDEAGIEQEKITLLQEGITINFRQKFRELFVWFIKQLQAFAKLFNNTFSKLSDVIVSKLKQYPSDDPMRIDIEWYRDNDLNILLDTNFVNTILNSITNKNHFSIISIDFTNEEIQRIITKLENTAKFKKVKMYSSESEWFRSTIACTSTCIKIRDAAKTISDNILSFTSTTNTVLSEFDDDEDEFLPMIQTYIEYCIKYLKAKELALKELFKLAFNNSIKVLTILKKYVDAKDAEKHLTDIQQLSLESYSYEIDNMFKQSHINEYGEIELYNLTNNGGINYD